MESWIVRGLGSACLAWLALTGVVYLIMYLTRRRAENGWLAGQSLCAVAYPLWLLGVAIDDDALVLALAVACTASVVFIRAHFELPAARRLWWLLLAVGVVGSALGHLGIAPASVVGAASMVVVAAAVAHQLAVLWRLARGTAQRFNARVLFGAWAVLGAALPVEAAGGHGAAIGALAMLAFLHTVALARQHGLSLDESERQRRELERRLATIEANSREIAALNEELRRQIGLRSRQLATALASLGARVSGLAVGSEFAGRYTIVGHLGTGGMGLVYEVVRRTDGRRFALKVLHGYARPDVIARFAREAEILAKVHHPNLVEIIDIDVSADGQLFLVMELVDGTPLAIAADAECDLAWRVRVLTQIASGVVAIHGAGIIHRDLKPANILVSTDGTTVKIADFGVSSFDPHNARDSTIDQLTGTGAIMGTPGYMAPELAGGMRATSPAVDVFGFGVLAYELLAGRAPFTDGALAWRLRGDTETPPRALADLAPGLPAELARVIHACLAWNPAERPAAATVVDIFRAHPAPARPGPVRVRLPTAPTKPHDDACA